MKNQFVWLRYRCGHLLSALSHTTQLKCVLAYAGSWPVMNWCPINEEINNSYTSLLNAKLSNVWIWGFISHTLTYVTLTIKDMRYSFITRLGAASKESYHEDTYPNLLHRYLKFDDEMSVISVVWRDSHQLIEQYNEEQVSSY